MCVLHDSDGVHLFHTVTQEVAFPCGDGRAEIRASLSGEAGSVVCAEGAGFEKAVQELLKARLLEDETGVRFLFDESSHEMRRLTDMQQAHSVVYLKASFTLQELFVSVKVNKFEMHRDGAFVFWCLRDLQRALSLSTAYARGGNMSARWVLDRFPSWLTALAALGFGQVHLMKAQSARGELTVDRCLCDHFVSTYGLMALLLHGINTSRVPHDRQRYTDAFKWFVIQCDAEEWTCFFAPGRMVHPATALSDWNSTPTATLEVKQGMVVDAQGFASADMPDLGGLGAMLAGVSPASPIHLLDFLLMGGGGVRERMQWFTNQVLVNVGLHLESQFMDAEHSTFHIVANPSAAPPNKTLKSA